MSIEAAVTEYRKTFTEQFETKVSMFRNCATKESMSSGQSAVFLVAGSGTDVAVTRGTNGLIPFGNPTNTQVTATLVEKHAPYELTGFNIFASQGDQKAVMRKASMNVINRDIDLTFLAELANATIDTGTTAPASVALVQTALAYLGNQGVPTNEVENMFGAITPGFKAYIEQTTEASSRDYVDVKVFDGPQRKMWRWAGVNWNVTNLITGLATATELCYVWHRDALGYAVNVGEDSINIGYDEKQDISWSRAKIYHACKILQNTGIVQLKHNGLAFALT